MIKASERLSSYPSPPWKLTGTAGLCLYLQPIGRARKTLPPLLEPVPVLPGRTLGGCLWGAFTAGSNDTGDERSFALVLEISALARLGRKRGWFVSGAFTGEAGIYGGLKSVWGIPSQLARASFSNIGSTSRYQISRGVRNSARSAFRPLGPGFHLDRPIMLLSEKQSRICRSVLAFQGAWRWATSTVRLDGQPELLLKPRFKVISAYANSVTLTLQGPEDIDLRGYQIHEEKQRQGS